MNFVLYTFMPFVSCIIHLFSRYLHSVLQKNRVVTEQNCGTLVEALRLIKNILEYFLQYMKQDLSRRICVQLLQTLNILFENITNQTAIYYLLSNNHTNAIITHRFDFTDEEVMAYYISFLKILSFRLNSSRIHFCISSLYHHFVFQSRREFDLYVEAIKLFAHPEGMVRIAVRTITLNVHKGIYRLNSLSHAFLNYYRVIYLNGKRRAPGNTTVIALPEVDVG
ncbi:unnamed protein product [Trichobilharzia regenti]|nr:unnamed protein product [Trichobilharzia regenti]